MSDEELAEWTLLREEDFPSGWESEPAPEQSPEAVEELRKLAECAGVDFYEIHDPYADPTQSPKFTAPDGETVAQTVRILSDEDSAKQSFKSQTSQRYFDCYAEPLQQFVDENEWITGVEVADMEFNKIDFPTVGNEAVAFQLKMPMKTDEKTATGYVDVVLVRVDDALMEFRTSGRDDMVVSTADLAGYAQLSVDRFLEGYYAQGYVN